MVFYAQLNENNICVGVSQLSGKVNNYNMIEIDSYDYDYMWKKYENGIWSKEKFEPKSTAPIDEFEQLKLDNEKLKQDNLTTLEACAELYELLLASQPI